MDYTGYIYSVLGQGVGYRDVVVSSAALPQPWDVTLKVDPNNSNSYVATVNPGTVNGVLPSNLTTGGNLTEFSIGSEFTYWTVNIESNGFEVTAATISTSTSPPTPQTHGVNAMPTTYSHIFGVTCNGSVYRTIGAGSIVLQTSAELTIDKQSPTPGLRSYDRYYLWA
jgi:hypothetical protein